MNAPCAAAMVLTALFTAGCASGPSGAPDEPLMTLAAAKQIIANERTRLWLDPGSIRDAKIGQPYSCPVAWPAQSCVCVEANARNRMGGYVGLKRNIAFIRGGKVLDMKEPRLALDRCEGLVPFPEIHGRDG